MSYVLLRFVWGKFYTGIRREWQNRIAANRTEEETNNFISAMQNALMKMAGGD